MNEFDNRMLSAMRGIDRRADSWLAAQGVPECAMHMWPGPIGAASVETADLGTFDFIEGRRLAFIQPVMAGDAYSAIVDLVAWYPDQPSRWWTYQYSGVPLGIGHLDGAEILGEPLMLRETPLDWLRAGGDGVCILDWKMSAPALRCLPALVVDEVAFGRRVHDRLSAPTIAVPEIRILRKEAA